MNFYISILCFICSLVIIGVVVWKYYKLEIVSVTGNSMYPTLLNGRLVLIRKRLKFPKDFILGRVYIYTCPKGYTVIKRLTDARYLKGEYYLFFEGDNASNSEDSRTYGYVSSTKVEGILVFNRKQKVT